MILAVMARRIETGSIDIEAIKDQYPLADAVRRHLVLKRRGHTMVGLCPFHMERTPSFAVYPQEERFHCFGCGAHGDIFDFLHHQEGLDIRAAAEHLTGGTFPVMSADRVAELKARQALFETEQVARRDAAMRQARERWIAADPAYTSHPYLEAKGIRPNGTRLDGAHILVPLHGLDGKIQSLQTIDPAGHKLFCSDLPTAGGLFVIGQKIAETAGPVLVCEGFATGATLHEATGHTVVVAFNAGNLAKVAERLAATHSGIHWIVAGDDDRGKAKNPGREAAIAAARILGYAAVFPKFPAISLGTDFNDMAAVSGLEAVRALLDADSPAACPDVYETLSLDEIDNMPPPSWRIEGLIPAHALVLLYGRPGEHKTFIALDMVLRVAYGLDWHGKPTKQTGVLYIAGEGKYGIGQRIKGWRREHGLEGVDAPFKLLPVAVHMLDPASIEKLKRTIHQVRAVVDFEIGLVVIDTVSRSIPGEDENSQEAMSMFIDGCAAIQQHCNGTVIGIHHAGKDLDRGMRGSTVLLGGCDTSIRVAKDEATTVLSVEKQKDGEELDDLHFTMKVVDLTTGLGAEQSTLVPVLGTSATPVGEKRLSWHQIREIFQAIDEAWRAGSPWSAFPHARRKGRFAVDLISDQYGVSKREAETSITKWQQHGYLVTEAGKFHGKASGLRVVKYLEPDR
ncbi:MAG: AAA family ATPase [Sphingomonas sp.]|uniref:AAA family ATPase n=1 Tax=Sphingomonas sp. TaxID=28214 RepID=UPI0035A950A1|nr:AAA family ATPase [Sphingomonas sp.]